MIQIVEVNYGIASFYNEGFIEINENLRKYPKLRASILNHELKHNTGSCADFWHDIKSLFDLRMQIDLFGFMINHPKSFTEILPVWVNHKKKLSWNYFLCCVYVVYFIIVLVAVSVLASV